MRTLLPPVAPIVACLVLTAAVVQAQTAPAAPLAPRPVGTMSDLMVTIIYPASDALMYIATRTPKSDSEWTELQGKALMVAESANLLMLPGRARDKDQWMADATLMLDAFTEAFRAAKRKDVAAIEELNERMVASCVSCHRHYRPGYGRRPSPAR